MIGRLVWTDSAAASAIHVLGHVPVFRQSSSQKDDVGIPRRCHGAVVIQPEEGSAVSNDAYSRAGRQTSGWAVGFIMFAAIMMIMVGVFQALQGLIAIFQNEFYVATRNYLFQFDATTWGWIHLLVGLLVAFAGWGLLSGRTWARVVALALAVLSAITNFLFIPYYPFWALLLITLDILVIWAIAAHGGELRDPV
jgi:hypothetical protein